MSNVVAWTTKRLPLVNLVEFLPAQIVSLKLLEGQYVVFGKVAFINFDESAQDAYVRLRLSDGLPQDNVEIIDETYVRIPGREEADRIAASVQAGVAIRKSRFVDIACETYKGGALDAQLAAIRVSEVTMI